LRPVGGRAVLLRCVIDLAGASGGRVRGNLDGELFAGSGIRAGIEVRQDVCGITDAGGHCPRCLRLVVPSDAARGPTVVGNVIGGVRDIALACCHGPKVERCLKHRSCYLREVEHEVGILIVSSHIRFDAERSRAREVGVCVVAVAHIDIGHRVQGR